MAPGTDEAAEAKLRQSEERFRTVFDHAPIGILLLGADTRILRANRALCALLGYEEVELVGRIAAELLHPEDRPESDRMRARVQAGEVDQLAVERRALRKDGHVIWLQVRSTVHRDAHGTIELIITQLTDVTEHRAQEQKLRESEARLRTIFEQAPIGIAVIAPAGDLLQVNHALAAMLGRGAAELERLAVPDVIHPDDVGPVRAQVEAALALGPDTFAGESRYLRPDGGVVWGAYHSTLIRDATGAPRYFISQVIDVTERKVAEEALRDSEARYRSLVQVSQDLIVRMDLTGNLTFVNDAWCAKFARTREEVIGRSVMPRIVDADQPTARDALAALTRPPHRVRVEIRQLAVDGIRWMEWEGCAIFDDAGRVVELQAIGRDITQEHEVAAALRTSLEELRQSEEKLRLLAQRQVAIREEERKRVGFDLHDGVCQELIGIGILVESARQRYGLLPGESCGELVRVGRYLGEVVEHVRQLAGELRPMLLHDLGLEGSLRSLAVGLSTATTIVQTTFPAPVPRLEEAAEVGVYRIAQEAVTNALRHAGARTVRLGIAIARRRLRLVVRDDGCGFDPSRRRTTALGLLSMEERALALGGRLEVASAPGRGTTIVLDCPLAVRRASAA